MPSSHVVDARSSGALVSNQCSEAALSDVADVAGSTPAHGLAPQVGDVAPDFSLKNQFGEDVVLSEAAAKGPVLVVFYPFAFSGICTSELRGLRDDPAWAAAGVRIVAVSCDPMFSLRAWSEVESYDFGLLSDFWPHGEVARAYGVFDERAGFSVRGTFLVGEGLRVRWSLVNAPGEGRDFSGALRALGIG